ADNATAAFDLDLAIGDRPGHMPLGADQKALADDEITFEAAIDLRVFGADLAFQKAGLRHRKILALLQLRLGIAFDDQPAAGADLAVERDLVADPQEPCFDGLGSRSDIAR